MRSKNAAIDPIKKMTNFGRGEMSKAVMNSSIDVKLMLRHCRLVRNSSLQSYGVPPTSDGIVSTSE